MLKLWKNQELVKDIDVIGLTHDEIGELIEAHQDAGLADEFLVTA